MCTFGIVCHMEIEPEFWASERLQITWNKSDYHDETKELSGVGDVRIIKATKKVRVTETKYVWYFLGQKTNRDRAQEPRLEIDRSLELTNAHHRSCVAESELLLKRYPFEMGTTNNRCEEKIFEFQMVSKSGKQKRWKCIKQAHICRVYMARAANGVIYSIRFDSKHFSHDRRWRQSAR